MIDRRPGVIARCIDDADVQAVVRTATDADIDLAIRSGGTPVPDWAASTTASWQT